MAVRILIGDARERLRDLPDGSVHCVVTSPPYWGLRAYGGDPGMIGLEPTFDEHLINLVAVFREVRRVLRSDGTLWLNYGDAYAANGASGGGKPSESEPGRPVDKARLDSAKATSVIARAKGSGLKPKDLMMMPARVAMALQADGWWLRSEIVWHKPNPMPESVTDRPTSAHEKLFLLSRRKSYYYDAEAVRVPAIRAGCIAGGDPDRMAQSGAGNHITNTSRMRSTPVASHANLRNVWTIATHAYSAAHFATFPPALVEPCIKAGTSEHGVCGECGAPWVRVVEEDDEWTKQRETLADVRDDERGGALTATWASNTPGVTAKRTTTGWRATLPARSARGTRHLCRPLRRRRHRRNRSRPPPARRHLS